MKNRLAEVDYFRAMACLAVVVVHVSSAYLVLETTGHLTQMFLLFGNRALSYVVPAFVFISGFVLAHNYHEKEFKYLPFLQKRLKYLLLPYFFWTAVYYLLFVYEGIYTLSFTFFAKKLLLGDMLYHLYFVVIILQFYLLFGCFQWLFKKFSSYYILFATVILQLLFMKYVRFWGIDRFFMQYLVFFVLGFCCFKHYDVMQEKIGKYQYLLAAGYLLLTGVVAQQFYQHVLLNKPYDVFLDNSIWSIFSVSAIFFYYRLALRLKTGNFRRAQSSLSKISGASYYIYLSHPLLLMCVTRIFNYAYIPSTIINFLLALFCILALVLPLTILYQSRKAELRKRLLSSRFFSHE